MIALKRNNDQKGKSFFDVPTATGRTVGGWIDLKTHWSRQIVSRTDNLDEMENDWERSVEWIRDDPV